MSNGEPSKQESESRVERLKMQVVGTIGLLLPFLNTSCHCMGSSHDSSFPYISYFDDW
jgi:hypothetical protein